MEKVESMKTPVDSTATAKSDNVTKAKEIIQGTTSSPRDSFALAMALKKEKRFGLARRILARARASAEIDNDHKLRLKIYQQSALCTYKDTDLPVDSRLDRALKLLNAADDLTATKNQETLGLAGGIYKRKWQVDNQKAQLEFALFYYLRGYEQGAENDQGYTGINAAFILDLLADQEGEAARKVGMRSESSEIRRQRAKEIRSDIIKKVSPLVELPGNEYLENAWWYYSTVAEAYFGLGPYGEENYDRAVEWLKAGREKSVDVPEWEYESTLRQLAALARVQETGAAGEGDMEQTRAWKALKEAFGDDAAPARSAFLGKIGIGLSGGGFRASLYHIGVLARLAELDVLRRIEVLSCVSGGSIIGAHYYLEVRKLLKAKEDKDVTREDYIAIVKRVQKEFLQGVQRNIRTRVAANPWTNIRMIFSSKFSRTMRAGELYEEEIFSLVNDGEGKEPRWLNDLYVNPKGEPPDFRPKEHNWRREAKVPMLVLNAATLNTGHSWHFTASYMGEPPAGIDSEIDGNDRLRRMYYDEAPRPHRKVRLGTAVAASACVPGLFEPIVLEGLYPERVVRLIDGGTCDNQGIAGLLEQDCDVILISDGSGQMESQKNPSKGLLGVPLRSTSILQARVRQSQFQDLSARKRSSLLRGFMFVHLKGDLDVDPVDWVECPDPHEADDDARDASRKGRRLTRYGIAKDVQQCLASVRTDLDSFSDVEAYALMTSGYRMTEYAFKVGKCVEGFEAPEKAEDWEFLEVQKGMRGMTGRAEEEDKYIFLKKLLSVSDTLAFKIWRLSKPLKVLAWVLAALTLVLSAWAMWRWRDTVIVEAITIGVVGLMILTAVLTALGTMFVGKTLMKIIRFRETLINAAVGLGTAILGWFAAFLHLTVFDKMYLNLGSLKSFKRQGVPSK